MITLKNLNITAFCNSDIINKYKEPITVKQGRANVIVPYYYAVKGNCIMLISKNRYNYKDGYFYIAKNIRNELFTIDENEVEIWDLNA